MELYRGMYSIQKTLRFELKPIGETKNYIKERGLIDEDQQKYNDSFKVKKLLDEYYSVVISDILSNFELDETLLISFNENLKNTKVLSKIITDLKKELTDELKTDIKDLTSAKVLIKLENYLESKNRIEDTKVLEQFKKFTTYYTNFFDSRKFILTGNKKGSISFRLIDENLRTFCENLKIFEKTLDSDLGNVLRNIEGSSYFTEFLSYNNLLTQEGIDEYNLCISGKSEDQNKKVQGINEVINLYNQQHNTKYQILQPLNKLILSDKQTFSFVLEKIESDYELYLLIDDFLKQKQFKNFFINKDVDLNNVYIANKAYALSNISNKIFGSWGHIQNKLNEDYEKNIDNKIGNKNFLDKRKKYFKNINVFSIKELNNLLDKNLYDEFEKMSQEFIADINSKKEKYLNLNKESVSNIKENYQVVEVIKNLLDSIKVYQEFLKTFYIPEVYQVKDSDFYYELDEKYVEISEIIKIYDKVRNYLTQKPYSIEKFKLNFNCPNLLSGWDLNKEKDYLGIMLRKLNPKTKQHDYYLGILKEKDVFDTETKTGNAYYEKMEYKLFPGANKQLPRMFISAKEYNEKLSEEFKESYKNKLHTKDKLDKNFLTDYIRYMQLNLEERYKDDFEFNFRNPEDYSQVDQFYREVEEQGYNIKYKNYDKDYIDKCVEEGKLYLFQIYSKDFSPHSKGLPNNQTIYFNTLFSDENFKKKLVRLNGGGEIFYRPKSIKYHETHPANVPIKNKTIGYKKEYSKFKYPIIKDKRYTENKFLFHFPITLNAVNSNSDVNDIVNNNIKDFKHIIGIDRGERNLIYIVVTDLDGNIVEQQSLNEIINEYKGNKYTTNYYKLLDDRQKKLLEERKNWKNIETIKELKEGYISQVVNKVVKLALEYKAVIVLENLLPGFKNSRKKVEKQVYQKFETQLIKKLNYVIDKKDPETCFKALQLTKPITTLEDIYSQTGIVFYIPAWNTSNIDPTTGFVNLLYGLKYSSVKQAKELITKIKDIRYNGSYYEFDIDFNDFKNYYPNTKTAWTVCTYGTRIRNYKKIDKKPLWASEEINLTEKIDDLFNEYEIDKNNIKESLLSKCDTNLFKDFIYYLRLTLQIRNSEIGTDVDYILSPVKNDNDEFFDSRKENPLLPKDADANGAYNIARKGIMLIKRIQNVKTGEKINYKITNEEYLLNLQKIDN